MRPLRAQAASSGNTTLLQLLAALALGSLLTIIVGLTFLKSRMGSGARPWNALTSERILGLSMEEFEATGDTLVLGEDVLVAVGSGDGDPAAALARAVSTGPAVWAAFTGREAVEFDRPIDALDVSFGAWIYLSSADRSPSMKTIVSNRDSGCDYDAGHSGFSLHVNNWDSDDGALVLQWRDGGGHHASGCARLSSDPGVIPYDSWVHVGFSLKGAREGHERADDHDEVDEENDAVVPGEALLFVNGKVLKRAVTSRGVAQLQLSRHLTLGMGPDRAHPFIGRIGHPFLSGSVIKRGQLAASVRLLEVADWGAMARAAHGRLLMQALLSSAPRDKVAELPPPKEEMDYDSKWIPAPTPLPRLVEAVRRLEVHGPDGKRLVLAPRLTTSGIVVVELTGRVKPIGSTLSGGSGSSRLRRRAAGGKSAGGQAAGAAPRARSPQPAATAELEAEVEAAVPAALARASVAGPLPEGAAADFTTGGNQWLPVTIALPAGEVTGSVDNRAALAAGRYCDDVTAAQLAASDELGRTRAEAVKAAMQHAWTGYKARAWGTDELRPVTGHGNDTQGGLGTTLVAALDTLLLMGMSGEFEEAAAWVASSLSFDDKAGHASVHQLGSQHLGALLAAYDLTGKPLFLYKARQLADRLLPAFDTPTGLPATLIDLATGEIAWPDWADGVSVLAEIASLQIELRYLSHATGLPIYAATSERAIRQLRDNTPSRYGLYPVLVSANDGSPGSALHSLGPQGDIFYDYLLKTWLQGSRNETSYRSMYDKATQGLAEVLLQTSPKSGLAFLADLDEDRVQHRMSHAACYVPGMLALGVYTAAGTPGEAHAARDLVTAKALMYTCWQMYERSNTGLAPDSVAFFSAEMALGGSPSFSLAAETAESLFILHQLSGNPVYREWGWRIFEAIERYCRVEHGYGSYPDVRDTHRSPGNAMPPPFLAETLKYLYLLQSPDHPVSLGRYVMTSAGHPLRVLRAAPTPKPKSKRRADKH